mmetsp:Transcript_9010/g.13485  ORF Transcript_9010/g.13485 Transcript_9010/m.13485 type:complete len:519 (-) Transcript_9010:166-1722(-)
MSQVSIWEEYIKDPTKNIKKALQSFGAHGIPERMRIQVWNAAKGEGHEFFEASLAGASPESFPEELLYELEALHTSVSFSTLTKDQIDRIGMVIQAHDETVSTEDAVQYAPGSIQIVARLIESSLGSDSKNDYQLVGFFSRLNQIMRKYQESMHDDFVVLLQMLRTDQKALCEHLDRVGVEVIDLVCEIELWVTTLFSDRFPPRFGISIMDLVMLDGPEKLAYIIFAIIKINAKAMMGIHDRLRLYSYITTMPESAERKEILDVARKSISMFESKMKSWREMKWETELSRSNKLKFIPRKVKEIADKKEDEKRFGMPTEGEEKEGNEEERLQLIHDLEALIMKTNYSSGRKALEHALDDIRSLSQSGTADWLTGTLKPHETKSRASDSRASTLDSAQREALAKGYIPYNHLYQYQDFPCLYMEGYLNKPKTKNVLHKRFFVLHGSYLAHFRSHKQRRTHKDVAASIRGATVKPIETPSSKFGIELSDSEGEIIYTLFADDHQIQQVWMRVLEAASKAD